MKINYVLIDYENVQPDNLHLLDRDEFRIRLFIGANQGSLKRDVAIPLQRLGPERAEYIEISGSGKNALDFHLAYYIGAISAIEKEAFFHIISKDTGFDPLIAYLKKRKVFCQRSARLEDIPLLRTLTACSLGQQCDAVVENMRGRGNSRPRTVKTLTSTVSALFGKKLDESAIERLLAELQRRGMVTVDGTRVSYSLPSAQ